jgi:hypothetical protein
VAVGYQAFNSSTSGNECTAIGYRAGYAQTTGASNLYVGFNAGNQGSFPLTTGNSNTYVGTYSGASAANVTSELVVCTGNTSIGKGSYTGYINGGTGGTYQGNNSSSWSTTSDQRLKKNISDNNDGLDKINSIRVRNFEYRLPTEVTELPQNQAIQKTGIQLGVIAQELQQVLPECVKQESTGVFSVDPDNLTWYLVNAIKEQQAIITTLTERITALEGA